MATLNVEMTGDEAKLFRSLQKIVGQQNKMKKGFEDVEKSGKKAGDATEKSFGQKAIKGLADFAAGLNIIKSGHDKILSVMKEIRAESEKAGKGLLEARETRAQLIQVAGGNQQEFQRLVAISNQLRTTQGLTAVQANRLTFQAKSAGLEQDVQFFGRLGEIGFEPTAGIEAVQKLQAAFGVGGATGAGTSQQIINKLLEAAAQSPVGAAEIARAASTASAAFANIGGSDEGLLALGAVFSETFKSPEAANQRIKSLATQLFKKSDQIDFQGTEPLKGLDLISNLSELGKQGRLTDEGGNVVDVKKFLGEANALEAVKAFETQKKEIQGIRERLLEADRLQGGGILSRSLEIAASDPTLRTINQSAIDKQKRLVGEQGDLGITALRAQSLQDRGSTLRREANQGKTGEEFFNFFGDRFEDVERTFKTERGFVESRQTFVPKEQVEAFGGDVAPGDASPAIKFLADIIGAPLRVGIPSGTPLKEDAKEIARINGEENLKREAARFGGIIPPSDADRDIDQR